MAKLLPTDDRSDAVPVAQGVLIGQYTPGVDAVPLIDANTANVLSSVNMLSVVQRPSLTEALFAACERSNIYDVYNGQTGQHLFVAKERSECFWRVCCAPTHSLFVEFKHAPQVMVQGPGGVLYPAPPHMQADVDIDTLPTVLTLEREGCPSKPCLGCCSCFDVCKDGMYLHAGPVPVKAGTLKGSGPQCVGFAAQPRLGGGFTPTINIMERAPGIGNYNTLAKVEGPCYFGGCMECCFSTKFSVSTMAPHQYHAKIGTADLATLIKQKPVDMEGMLREALTDADIYTIEFNPAANLAPQQKATMLGAQVLADFMFFEKNAPMCTSSSVNLCSIYCCGCVCPCAIGSSGRGGGGGGGFNADQ